MNLNKLISIEEKIERYFIALAEIEVRGLGVSLEYEETYGIIYNLVNEEKKLLGLLSIEEIISLRKQILKLCNTSLSPIALGHSVNANYHRLLNILNTMLGSEYFDYAAYLRYDLNQVIFAFLDYLINSEDDQEIRKDLIFYKYNLIFMNHLSEDDFLQTGNIATINIKSKCYKTDFNPDLVFVDKAILVLEAKEHMEVILNHSEDLKDNSNYYTLVIVSIMELMARLVLCEDDTLHYIQQDFDYLLESDDISLDVKNIIQKMLITLEQLKSKIEVTR